MNSRHSFNAVAIVWLMAVGCDKDQRVADVAREAADRQAAQNEAAADLQEEVARSTKLLIEEQTATRLAADAERHQLNEGWNDLEEERRAIAKDRRTVSFLVTATRGGGWVLLALCGVAIVGLLVWAARGPAYARSSNNVRALATSVDKQLAAEQKPAIEHTDREEP